MDRETMEMWRRFGGIAAGAVVVGAVVLLLQALAASLSPLPAGIDPRSPTVGDATGANVPALPAGAWLLAMAAEVVGAFCGAVVGGWAARERRGWVAAVVVGLALVGSVLNWISFEHPGWFIAAQVVAYPVVWVLAVAWVRRLVPPDAPEPP